MNQPQLRSDICLRWKLPCVWFDSAEMFETINYQII